MASKVLGSVILLGLAVALVLVLFQAEGAPSQPGVALSGQLNPSTAQTVQVTFTNYLYSTQPPNSIVDLGTAVVYSVLVDNTTSLAFNQRAATSTVAVSGQEYKVVATVSVAIPQLCSGTACSGFVENFTVSAYAAVSTYVGFWNSPTLTVSFSNTGGPARVLAGAFAGQAVTATAVSNGPSSPATFYYETFGMLTLFVGLGFLVAYLFLMPHQASLVTAIILILVFIVEYILWVVVGV
jgi:hypothetical protein